MAGPSVLHLEDLPHVLHPMRADSQRSLAVFEFQRKNGEIKWHMCQNCPEWPKSDFEVRIGKMVPESDEVCWECHGRDKCGDCDLKMADDSESP
jgi:hypothetical protein